METTIWGYIGIMENNMETIIWGYIGVIPEKQGRQFSISGLYLESPRGESGLPYGIDGL